MHLWPQHQLLRSHQHMSLDRSTTVLLTGMAQLYKIDVRIVDIVA